ncbi:radical SAM family heme chaperone HemW [Blastomonas sp.]|uniref:radical SAM family heme chaperone HemW n=1 Tax=Blastomonas sp. TaxID=1909299 RepID=UPI00262F57CF|nr:radical SAM family heme chaperone HemW [Blastomonas sp.]MDM7956742.1 radical SAM family heme chaperone HemW [Blastomonas sp.]
MIGGGPESRRPQAHPGLGSASSNPPASGRGDESLALYIHWPFCVSKCPYCDFNSHVREGVDVAQWQAALLADMAHEAALLPGRTLGSIFFGGGTPSLMPPALVQTLIEQAAQHWRFADDIEITLEANPSSVESARFADLALAGVNRVSLGLQALDDNVLAFLGRAHSVTEALAALDIAQDRFARVTFDLIYARPGQSLADWERELTRALGFGTGHLSLYQLTIEPGTRFETLVRRGELVPADDDHCADLFDLTRQMTGAAGLPAYEISNHARIGQQSRHNLTYWRYGDYAGIGPGAHGRRRAMATERHRKPENYLSAITRNGHGLSVERPLDAETQATEALLMGLRLAEGIDLERIAQLSGVPQPSLIDEAATDRLVALGLVERSGQHITVTPQGMPLLDAILAEVVAIEPAA